MLVRVFRCPNCGRTLKPSTPQPEGKRIKCPLCAKAITVPAAEPEEVEEIEELEEIEEEPEDRVTTRRRSARRQEEEADPRPVRKRRAFREDDLEDEDEEDSPQRRKPRRKKARSGSGLTVALIIGGFVLGIAGLGIGGYFLLGPLFESPVHRRARVYDEATAILNGVNDQGSAVAAKAALVRVGEQLKALDEKDKAELEKALKKLQENPDAVKRAFEEAMRNPNKAQTQASKLRKEHEVIEQALGRLITAAVRVSKVPGGQELLTAFYDAWGPGAGMVRLAVQVQTNLGGF